jgi:O-methyltransferase involved in polyketide biosynthesis
MEDAERKSPVCNDQYAKIFMDERGMKIFGPFKSEIMPNISNITRCRIIDDIISSELGKNKNTLVVTIGCGFDTRPYRLTGGSWIEIDEPQIITYKNEKLPVDECRNRLHRISIDFSHESLRNKLRAIETGQSVIIVIEGVFMYLEPESINATLSEIQDLYPVHVLLCDLMTKKFFDKYAQSIHSKLVTTGGTFSALPDNPEKIFIDNKYIEIDRIPMVKRAIDLGLYRDALNIPAFISRLMLAVFMKDMNGYSIYRFHHG